METLVRPPTQKKKTTTTTTKWNKEVVPNVRPTSIQILPAGQSKNKLTSGPSSRPFIPSNWEPGLVITRTGIPEQTELNITLAIT